MGILIVMGSCAGIHRRTFLGLSEYNVDIKRIKAMNLNVNIMSCTP